MRGTLSIVSVALLFNALDIVTGLIIALKNNNIESAKLRDGLFKKVGFVICYILAYLIDHNHELIGINIHASILPVMCGYSILTEIVSIVENVGKLNPELLPEKLFKIFKISQNDKTDNINERGVNNERHQQSSGVSR